MKHPPGLVSAIGVAMVTAQSQKLWKKRKRLERKTDNECLVGDPQGSERKLI